MKFTDRNREIELLQTALRKQRRSFVVVYGRRRLGKSTLVKRVLSDRDVYFMADISESSNQRHLLAMTVAAQYPGFDQAIYPSWESILLSFNQRCTEGMTLCIDELPYLVKSDESLPSVLQKLLDSHRLRFNLIVCGSSQQMMFDIALNESSPLYGRADEILRLNPIPASYMPEALGITPKEAVEEYAVWGGVPRYWELREESTDIDSALRHFCINPHGLLYDEVVHVLRDDMRDLVQATTILTVIGNGANKMSEIAARVNKEASSLTGPVRKLLSMNLICREVPFGDNPKDSKKSMYHLADPFMQFYYRFMVPYRSFIEIDRIDFVMRQINAQWNGFVANMWEQLCRRKVSGQEIDGELFGIAGRWWGNVPGGERIELDVVAESFDKRTLLIGECKWTSADDASRLEHILHDKVSKLPFISKYQNVKYVLFLKEKPTKPSSCLTLFPEDIIL